MNNVINIDRSLPSLRQDRLIGAVLYGSDAFNIKTNCKILICTLQFIKNSHIFLTVCFPNLLDFAYLKILMSIFLKVYILDMAFIV